MHTRNRIIRRVTVLVAALAAVVTGCVGPAQGASAGTQPAPGKGPAGPGKGSAGTGITPAGVGGAAALGTGQRGTAASTAARSEEDGARSSPRAAEFRGQAFDTCNAPSLETMRAWRKASPFEAVGVYVGGRARACKQQNLTPEWVREVNRMGWKLLPLYVGSQSPCVKAANKQQFKMGKKNPWGQGAQEGRDAVARAKALGLQRGSPLYLDMESYNQRDNSCAATTLRFVKGWNDRVRKAGYLTGFYSSAGSGIAHMERARKAGEISLPQIVWFARWRVPGDVDNEPVLAPDAWQPHRRIHQYQGDVKKKYGGHTLNIDRNMVDAPVAVVG